MPVINENWALLCEIGFWGWVLSVTGLLIRMFTRKSHLNRKYVLLWVTLSAIFFAFWILGMTRA
jgi:hypothetical protein